MAHGAAVGATVAEAMLVDPALAGVETTVREMRAFLADGHVHCGLIVDGDQLAAVVVREDLEAAPDDALAMRYGACEGRTTLASNSAEAVRTRMVADGIRRLAVVDEDQRLLGLLCLKSTGRGFCSPADVAARAADRRVSYDAVVLAGGRARRMGGVDKTALVVGGRSVLEHVLAGLGDAGEVIVVGPEVDGGPVTAVTAGLDRVTSEVVVVLAGDMPFVAGAVSPLVDAVSRAPQAEVAVLVSAGRRQYLAAAWRTSALTARLRSLAAPPAGSAMRSLYVGEIVEVADTGGWSVDVDTPDDLRDARTRVS